MDKAILSRADAIQIGSMTYYTGKPCKKGHVADRETVSGSCLECGRERARLYARSTQNERRQSLRETLRRNAQANAIPEG